MVIVVQPKMIPNQNEFQEQNPGGMNPIFMFDYPLVNIDSRISQKLVDALIFLVKHHLAL